MKFRLSPDVLALNPGAARVITVDGEKASARKARVPRAGADQRIGLTPLLVRGWSLWSDGQRVRLYKINQPRFDTGYCSSEAEACRKAKEIESNV